METTTAKVTAAAAFMPRVTADALELELAEPSEPVFGTVPVEEEEEGDLEEEPVDGEVDWVGVVVVPDWPVTGIVVLDAAMVEFVELVVLGAEAFNAVVLAEPEGAVVVVFSAAVAAPAPAS